MLDVTWATRKMTVILDDFVTNMVWKSTRWQYFWAFIGYGNLRTFSIGLWARTFAVFRLNFLIEANSFLQQTGAISNSQGKGNSLLEDNRYLCSKDFILCHIILLLESVQCKIKKQYNFRLRDNVLCCPDIGITKFPNVFDFLDPFLRKNRALDLPWEKPGTNFEENCQKRFSNRIDAEKWIIAVILLQAECEKCPVKA